MCRRYSRTEGGILHLAQNVRPDVRAQRFGRDQVHVATKEVFEEGCQVHEVVERLLRGLKFNENIDVALIARLVSHERPKQTAPLDAQGSQLSLGFTQAREDLFL